MDALFPQLAELRQATQALREQAVVLSDGDPTPEEQAEFDAMARDKQLALVGMISVLAHIKPDSDPDEASRMVDTFIPDLVRPVLGMGPGALGKANLNVIMHLLRALAEERGEPIDITWQREAMELTREASGE